MEVARTYVNRPQFEHADGESLHGNHAVSLLECAFDQQEAASSDSRVAIAQSLWGAGWCSRYQFHLRY